MRTSRYFLVITREDDRRTLRRALYDHSRVVAEERDLPFGTYKGKTVSIVETVATDASQAEYLAAYQVGRLQSFGSIGTSREIFATYSAAEQEAGENYDAYPETIQAHDPYAALAAEFGTDRSEWTL